MDYEGYCDEHKKFGEEKWGYGKDISVYEHIQKPAMRCAYKYMEGNRRRRCPNKIIWTFSKKIEGISFNEVLEEMRKAAKENGGINIIGLTDTDWANGRNPLEEFE